MLHQSDARQRLRQALGATADFRNGQWPALQQLLSARQSLLVIQPTGWGKSALYFLACQWLRQQDRGPTLLVSPLLALMRNQAEHARRFRLQTLILNSQHPDAWQRLGTTSPDLIITSPESLTNARMQRWLAQHGQALALVVVDEAHCISEWGHQFRPDYRLLSSLRQQVSKDCLWLATTATAPPAVAADIQQQLGQLTLLKGSLNREQLRLHRYYCRSTAERWQWLGHWLRATPGPFLIYCLTVDACEQLARQLQGMGLAVAAYHAQQSHRPQLEQQLLANELNGLICTNALGMGFDKADIRLVVHWQAPATLAAYYQQAGRAGRDGQTADAVLLSGPEDQGLQQFFQLLSQQDAELINRLIHSLECGQQGTPALAKSLKINQRHCQRLLKIVAQQADSPLIQHQGVWQLNKSKQRINTSYFNGLQQINQERWQEVERYLQGEGCLMQQLLVSLGEVDAPRCGRCQTCLGGATGPQSGLATTVDNFSGQTSVNSAAPRPLAASEPPGFQHFRQYHWLNQKRGFRPSLPGLALSSVQQDWLSQLLPHHAQDCPQVLVSMLLAHWPQLQTSAPQWIAYLPQGRSDAAMENLAQRLALALSLSYVPAFQLQRLPPRQPNYAQLDGTWQVMDCLPGRALLLIHDDFGGRATTLGACLLARAGCQGVVPWVLSCSA